MSRNLARVGTVAIFFLVAACSGEVAFPTAQATAQQMTVNTGNVVRLDGSGSKDPQGRTLFYEWSFVSIPQGSAATLRDADQVLPSFMADVAGDYVIQLVVSNGVVKSQAVTITIHVTLCGFSPPVVTVAQGTFNVNPTARVALSATASDPDNACIIGPPQTVSVTWSVVSRPSGSSSIILAPASANTTFTPDVAGAYQLQVIATDSTGLKSVPAFVNVTASCSLPGVTVTGPSIASARHFDGTETPTPSQIFRGDVVTLTASGTSQCLTSNITFAWELTQKPPGSTAQLLGADTATPSFTADVAGGSYGFLVRLTDSLGNSNSATFLVNVEPVPAAPTITGLPAFVTAGTSGAVTVTGVSGAAYSCTAANAVITSGASGTLTSGTATLNLTAGATAGPLTVTCVQFGGIIASDAGTASTQVVLQTVQPTITAPTTATANQVYTASVPAHPGMTYTWSVNGGATIVASSAPTAQRSSKVAIATTADGATSSVRFNVGGVGSFQLSVTETNPAGDSSTSSTIILVVPAAQPPLITAPSFVTAGAPYTASIAPRTGATYRWSITRGTITGGNTAASISFTAPATPGAFTLSCTETNAAGDSTATSQSTVTAIAAPPGTLAISAPNPVGAGLAYIASVATRAGASNTWSVAPGLIISQGGNAGVNSADGSTNSITFIPGPFTSPGANVHVAVTQTDQASATTSGSADLALLAPTAPSISAPSTVTTGRTYTASVATKPNATYRWQISGGGSIVSANGDAGVTSADGRTNSIRFTSGPVGSETVSVTESDAVADVTSNSLNVMVEPAAVAPTITAPHDVTSTRSYTASVPARDRFTYVWTISNGTIASGAATGITLNGVNTLTFAAGLPAADNSFAVSTLTATETNAAGDSSASSISSMRVFPNPQARTITVVKQGTTTAITKVSDGSAFTYVASVTPTAHMHYSWTAPAGMNGTQSGTSGETFTFSFTAGTGSVAGAIAALSVAEINEIDDFATGSTNLSVYSAPTTFAITIAPTPSFDGSGNFRVTSGNNFNASIFARGGANTYQWTANNLVLTPPATGGNVHFVAGVANADGSAKAASLSVTETNGAGDSAISTSPGLVYPAPQPPALSLTANGSPIVSGDNVTAGDSLQALVTPQAGMSFNWGATNSNPLSGVGLTINFTGVNNDPDGNPVDVVLTVVARNLISEMAVTHVTLHVYPKPNVPAFVIKDAGNATVTDGSSVTAGDALHATVTDQAGMTFLWSAPTNSNPANQTGVLTFNFTGTNTDTAGNPVTLTLTATARNGIGATATSNQSLQVYPRPTTPDLVLKDSGNNVIADGANVTAATGFTATTTTAQKSTITYQWTVTPSANRANLSGVATTTSTFDLLANSDNTNALITVKIEVSNAINFKLSATQTALVHPAPQTPTIHIVGPNGNDSFVTQGAVGVRAQITARDHLQYAWTYAAATGTGIVAGTFTNPGHASGDLDGSGHNFVEFSVPSDALQIRLSATELNDLGAASGLGKLQAAGVAAPSVQSFSADPTSIFSGGASHLAWASTGGSASIDNSIGTVSNTSSRLATGIATTTTFTLTVTNAAGTPAVAGATVTVTTPTTGWQNNNDLGLDGGVATTASGPYSMAFDTADAETVYAATLDAGVLVSQDGGAPPWNSTGLSARTTGVSVGHPDGGLSLWAVPDCNGTLYHSADGGSWRPVDGTLGNGLPPSGCPTPAASTPDIRLDPSDPSQQTIYVSFNGDGLFHTQNDGTNWSGIALSVPPDNGTTRLAISSTGVLFVGTTTGNVFKVSSGTVTPLTFTGTGAVTALATDSDGNFVAVGRDNGTVESVVFSTNSVIAPSCVDGTLVLPCATSPVQGLAFAFDGTTSGGHLTGSVYCVTPSKVFRSSDLGATFDDVTTTFFASPIFFSISINPLDGTSVFALGSQNGFSFRRFGPH